MSVINTNITSLIAQQNLNASKSDLTTAMERLSSGLRINSSADDAAGQAIANRMSAQITGLSQAQRNANDGISVAQTTEGALNQVNDNLQRIRELTVQASNGTNSTEDLSSIQDEIGRISEETSFNGVKVLASDQTIDIKLSEINAETLGLDNFDVTTGVVNSEDFGATVADAATGVSVKFDVADLTAATDANGAATTTDTSSIFEMKDGGGYAVLASDGNYYSLDTTSTTAIDADTVNTEAGAVDSIQAGVTLDTTSNLSGASITEINDAAGNGTGEYVLDNGDGTYNMVSIDSAGVATEGAEVSVDPLAALDTALSTVDGLRSDLGALQNRFDSAITNLTAARSRIQDADYATEVSNMTRNQILQQAGTSILAQANQLPQSVLSLLG